MAGGGQVLVAGNWAANPPYTVNPGYFSPRAEEKLGQVSADSRWMDLTRTQRVLGWQLVGTSSLPPDWANVDAAGTAVPTGPPGGGPVQFGLAAARLPVRYAESCDPADRALAVAMRPILTGPGDVPALRNLDGSAASDWQHPVAVVASAATEKPQAMRTPPPNDSTRRDPHCTTGIRPITVPPGSRWAESCCPPRCLAHAPIILRFSASRTRDRWPSHWRVGTP